MNFKNPVPSGPLEAAAAIQTKAESKPTETSKVTISRHLTTKESAVAIESPWAAHRSRGIRKWIAMPTRIGTIKI
jgi:hypothetical protein